MLGPLAIYLCRALEEGGGSGQSEGMLIVFDNAPPLILGSLLPCSPSKSITSVPVPSVFLLNSADEKHWLKLEGQERGKNLIYLLPSSISFWLCCGSGSKGIVSPKLVSIDQPLFLDLSSRQTSNTFPSLFPSGL